MLIRKMQRRLNSSVKMQWKNERMRMEIPRGESCNKRTTRASPEIKACFLNCESTTDCSYGEATVVPLSKQPSLDYFPSPWQCCHSANRTCKPRFVEATSEMEKLQASESSMLCTTEYTTEYTTEQKYLQLVCMVGICKCDALACRKKAFMCIQSA